MLGGHRGFGANRRRHASVGVVTEIVTGQSTGIGATIVRNGRAEIKLWQDGEHLSRELDTRTARVRERLFSGAPRYAITKNNAVSHSILRTLCATNKTNGRESSERHRSTPAKKSRRERGDARHFPQKRARLFKNL